MKVVIVAALYFWIIHPGVASAHGCVPTNFPPRPLGHEIESPEGYFHFRYLSDIDQDYKSGMTYQNTCVQNISATQPLILIWEKARIFFTAFNRLPPLQTNGWKPREISNFDREPDRDAPICYTQIPLCEDAELYQIERKPRSSIKLETSSDTSIIDELGREISVYLDLMSSIVGDKTVVQLSMSKSIRALAFTESKALLNVARRAGIHAQIKAQGGDAFIAPFLKVADHRLKDWLPASIVEDDALFVDTGDNPEIQFQFHLQSGAMVEPVTVIAIDGEGKMLTSVQALIYVDEE